MPPDSQQRLPYPHSHHEDVVGNDHTDRQMQQFRPLLRLLSFIVLTGSRALSAAHQHVCIVLSSLAYPIV